MLLATSKGGIHIKKRRFKYVWKDDMAGPRYELGPAATIAAAAPCEWPIARAAPNIACLNIDRHFEPTCLDIIL
jgi:hypothetical protein